MERSGEFPRRVIVRTTVTSLLIVMLVVAACGTGSPRGADGATGTLVIRPVYEPPPPDEPISFGGYGFYATVGEVSDQEIPFHGTLRVELPAGPNRLTIVTRALSDVLGPGQDEPEALEVTAECEAEVEVPADDTVEVVYRAVGGATCEIVSPRG
jgi:hypothetical protein